MRSPVDYTSRSGVASIMLASTESGNALSPALLSALTEAIERAERDASCRAILLVAAGPSFSLPSWLGREDVAEDIQHFADGFSPPWFQRYKRPGYTCSHE